MSNIKITTEARLANGLRDMVDSMTGKRRIGMVYFQKMEENMFLPRVLLESTDKVFLKEAIKKQIIYVPLIKTTAETT